MPKWNYFVTNVEKVSNGPIGKGTLYHQTRKTDEQEYKITEYDPKKKVSITTIPPSPHLKMSFYFKENGKNTDLIDEWEFETGRNILFEKLGKAKIKSAVKNNLEKLKYLLENGEVQLQDGRVEKIQ
jgi:hypothetical protein